MRRDASHLAALLDFALIRYIAKTKGPRPMTPAEIAKLTEQAKRGKALMARSSKAAERSTSVFDQYEATLGRFEAGVDQVDSQEKALAAQLTAMGNAGPILDATFQDGAAAAPVAGPEVPAAKPTFPQAVDPGAAA